MAERNLEVNILARDSATPVIKGLQSTIIRFVGAVTAALAGLRAVAFPVEAAREFERALADVAKTTGFTKDEIALLGDELLQISRTVDTSANDLARIAAAAGQLGLGREGGQAITQFTESVARAATTLDLTADEAATNFAKIANIFGQPIQNTERLISTVNELSNTTVASADQLLDVIRRVGTITGTFQESAALAAQALELGVSPEVAGTSLVKIFSNFESRADEFAEQFGITVGDFLGKGTIERWQFYLNELGKLTDDEAARVINRLSGSGRIFALVRKQVEDASRGFPIFTRALANSETAFEEGTSAIEEYEKVADTLTVQLARLGNNFRALAIQIGNEALPVLRQIVEDLIEFLQSDEAFDAVESLGEVLKSTIQIAADFARALARINPDFLVDGITALIILIGTRFVASITRAVAGIGIFTNSLQRIVVAEQAAARATQARVAVLLNSTVATQRAASAAGAAAAAAASQVGLLTGAFAALGRAVALVSRFLGPIGLIISTAILFFDDLADAVRGVFGAAEETQVQLTEALEREAGRQQAIINQQIADFQRLKTELEKGIKLDLEFEALDTDATFTQITNFAKEAAAEFTKLSNATRGAAEEEARLRREIDQLIEARNDLILLANQREAAGIDATQLRADIDRTIDAERRLEQQIEDTVEANNRFTASVRQVGQELLQTFDQDIVGVVELAADFRRAEDRAAQLQDRLEQLDKLELDPRVEPELDEAQLQNIRDTLRVAVGGEPVEVNIGEGNIRAQVAAVAADLRSRLAELQTEAVQLGENLNQAVGQLRQPQRDIVTQSRILEARLAEVEAIEQLVEGAEQANQQESERLAQLREQAPAILAQKFAYDEINESLQQQAVDLENNRKAAQGAFDNTTAEVRALVAGFQEASRGARDILEIRAQTLRFERRIELANDNIAARTERIAELERIISGEVEFKSQAEEVYARNKARDELASLRAANALDEQAAAVSRRNQEQLRLNQLLTNLPRLQAQLAEAAATGQAAPFESIKNQIEDALGESQGIVNELADLQGPDGNFLFREGEILNLQAALDDAANTYTSAIPGLNEELLKGSQELEQEVLNQISQLAQQFAPAIQGFEDLVKAFPEVASNLSQIREEWEQVNQPLIDAIDAFATSSRELTTRGLGLPENFGDQIQTLAQAVQQAATTTGVGETGGRIVDVSLEGFNLANVQQQIATVAARGLDDTVVDPESAYFIQIRDAVKDKLEEALRVAETGVTGTGLVVPVTPEPVVSEGPTAAAGPGGVSIAAPTEATLTETFQRASANGIGQGLQTPQAQTAATDYGKTIAAGVTEGLRQSAGAGFLTGGGRSLASGGMVRGPGTSTSDSIPAWLSNGEFVSDAATVRHFGADFFAALKRMARGRGTSLTRMRRGLPAFADGGFVSQGSSGYRPVNINIPGLGSYPMFAAENVVAEVARAVSRETLKRGTKGNLR